MCCPINNTIQREEQISKIVIKIILTTITVFGLLKCIRFQQMDKMFKENVS